MLFLMREKNSMIYVPEFFLNLATILIVHSESNYFQLTKHFGIKGDRVTQIPSWSTGIHHKENITRDSARNMLNLEPKDRVILIFGTIRPYKGIDIALEAFARALEDIPEARLVIAGKLWESWDRYEKIIKEKNISEYLVKHLSLYRR